MIKEIGNEYIYIIKNDMAIAHKKLNEKSYHYFSYYWIPTKQQHINAHSGKVQFKGLF